MAKISDELREWAGLLETSAYTKVTAEKISAIADRIDAEMAELPRDKDGKPIHVGDTVYGKDGKAWCVRGVTIGEMSEALRCTISVASDTDGWRHIRAEWFAHERPDSLERIADEIEESDVDGCTDWANRIRRLAKERGHGRE